MKNLIVLFVLVSASCSAQVIGIKLANQKTFNTMPAASVTTDSITISNISDSGIEVSADVTFYEIGNNFNKKTEHLIVWTGAAYITNKDWTKPNLKSAVKTILQNQ